MCCVEGDVEKGKKGSQKRGAEGTCFGSLFFLNKKSFIGAKTDDVSGFSAPTKTLSVEENFDTKMVCLALTQTSGFL